MVALKCGLINDVTQDQLLRRVPEQRIALREAVRLFEICVHERPVILAKSLLLSQLLQHPAFLQRSCWRKPVVAALFPFFGRQFFLWHGREKICDGGHEGQLERFPE
jgi:hypothetical protein